MDVNSSSVRTIVIVAIALIGIIVGVIAPKFISIAGPAGDAGVTMKGLAMAGVIAFAVFAYMRWIYKS